MLGLRNFERVLGLVSLLLEVRVSGLSPFGKRRRVTQAFVPPDIVTMQRVTPNCAICRMMSNVETQCCEQAVPVGNTESMLDRPIVE